MNAKNVPCRKCGGKPEIRGQDWQNTEGPWYIVCSDCGEGTICWAYQREAWQQWKFDNREIQETEKRS